MYYLRTLFCAAFICICIVFIHAATFKAKLGVIKRVAIVGSGPAGLGLAASIKQLNTGIKEVHVFDSKKDFLQTNLGGGVQLSGGAAVLEKIGCLDLLKGRGERLRKVLARNSGGDVLLKLDIDVSVKTKVPNALCELTSEGGSFGEPMVYSVMRDALQQVLYEATQTRYSSITEDKEDTSSEAKADKNNNIPSTNTAVIIKGGKECIQAEEDDKTGTVSLKFADGSSEGDFDVVFGADGISSVLRKYTKTADQSLLYPFDLKVLNPEGVDLVTPRKNRYDFYTGIRITYGVTPPDPDFLLRPPYYKNPPAPQLGTTTGGQDGEENGRGAFHQWFGDGCYVLAASYGGLKGPQHGLFVVYRDDEDSPEGENSAWKQRTVGPGGLQQSDTPYSTALARIRKAGLGTKTEILSLLNACGDTQRGGRFLDLGVRDRAIPLKSWSSESGRIVLLGDSAHAMAPFLGQGANQALQDAYFIASGLEKINSKLYAKATNSRILQLVRNPVATKREALKSLARDYEFRRKIATGLISAKSNILGFIETLGGLPGMFFRDNFFRVMAATGIAEQVYLDGAVPKPSLRDVGDKR